MTPGRDFSVDVVGGYVEGGDAEERHPRREGETPATLDRCGDLGFALVRVPEREVSVVEVEALWRRDPPYLERLEVLVVVEERVESLEWIR